MSIQKHKAEVCWPRKVATQAIHAAAGEAACVYDAQKSQKLRLLSDIEIEVVTPPQWERIISPRSYGASRY